MTKEVKCMSMYVGAVVHDCFETLVFSDTSKGRVALKSRDSADEPSHVHHRVEMSFKMNLKMSLESRTHDLSPCLLSSRIVAQIKSSNQNVHVVTRATSWVYVEANLNLGDGCNAFISSDCLAVSKKKQRRQTSQELFHISCFNSGRGAGLATAKKIPFWSLLLAGFPLDQSQLCQSMRGCQFR